MAGKINLCKFSYLKIFSELSAFTLAEVLITLTVVGVIAALTIPALTSDINDAQLRVQWKKAFAEISQATMMCKALYGDIDFSTFDSMRNSYAKVMNFTKVDGYSNIAAPFYTYYKNTHGQGLAPSDNVASAITADGILIRFAAYGTTGGLNLTVPNSGFCTAQVSSLTRICADLLVDINGKKGPNMYGKDFYRIWIVKKNGGYVTYPAGSNADGRDCLKDNSDFLKSEGCSAKALYTDNLP